MKTTQSAIDSLRELNSKLTSQIVELREENAEIPELRKKYTEVEAENVKLRRVIEENTELKTRFEELEKKNKTDTSNLIAENLELKDRVTKLEQNRIQVITNEQEASPTKVISDCSELPVTSQSSIPPPTEDCSIDSVPLEKNSGNNPEKIENISDNTSNSDIYQESGISKSLEEKEINDFLYEKNKESISNMIRERNREKKIQAQVSHNASSVPADSPCNKILDTSPVL
ncbi:hypothetical protein Glove_107g7 [Diversispora epigaea]|uniref:Uncharacterized protein n=1 Tax=Diversispora epigaea TaxID=1348612 RepID=A0A397J7B7_9GLOM|nr:hypothetical protein Glove_107g7 [Diversispora epigaea]